MKPEESTATEAPQPGEAPGVAARRRAAAELVARHESALKRTARRYSLCAEDAEDAYQRALEILLTKAPTVSPRELIRWTHTVTKHEALAVRRQRERLLGSVPRADRDPEVDWLELVPSASDGPAERLERQELVRRSREALQALKPAELRALTLLAEGYSYAEISEITGFSATKVNRCLAEGRERFRQVVAGSEDGSRCAQMRALLSAVCDGEASADDERRAREHLRACPGCRATMRAYRSAAPAIAALGPGLEAGPSLLERAGGLVDRLRDRMPGGGTADQAAGVAAGGAAKGGGAAAVAKAVAVCAGIGGGAMAAVAVGVGPADLDPVAPSMTAPHIERIAPTTLDGADSRRDGQRRPADRPRPASKPRPEPTREAAEPPAPAPETVEATPAPAPEAVEAAPAPVEPEPIEAEAAPAEPAPSAEAGSAAGEFGP